MKLPYLQLSQHLTKQLAPIYFISGDDLLQMQEALDLLRQTAVKAGYSERVRIPVDSNADWGNHLYANAHSMSLFSSKRILELDLRNVKINQSNSEPLKSYAEKPLADTLLLISANKLDKKIEQTAWYKMLEKNGVVIPIWPINAEQFPQWIMQRAQKIQLKISKSAAQKLADHVEGNLLAAAQELEKLRLITDTVDETTLENILTDNASFDIYNLVDSLLTGNQKRSLRILSHLRGEDTEPTLILWAITRELRTLAEIMQQTQRGTTLSALFSQFRIWEKRQPSVRAYLQRNSLLSVREQLMHAAQIDRMIKGAEDGSVWNELERFILQAALLHKSKLAQKNRRCEAAFQAEAIQLLNNA